jgi:hypothetical protein
MGGLGEHGKALHPDPFNAVYCITNPQLSVRVFIGQSNTLLCCPVETRPFSYFVGINKLSFYQHIQHGGGGLDVQALPEQFIAKKKEKSVRASIGQHLCHFDGRLGLGLGLGLG